LDEEDFLKCDYLNASIKLSRLSSSSFAAFTSALICGKHTQATMNPAISGVFAIKIIIIELFGKEAKQKNVVMGS